MGFFSLIQVFFYENLKQIFLTDLDYFSVFAWSTAYSDKKSGFIPILLPKIMIHSVYTPFLNSWTLPLGLQLFQMNVSRLVSLVPGLQTVLFSQQVQVLIFIFYFSVLFFIYQYRYKWMLKTMKHFNNFMVYFFFFSSSLKINFLIKMVEMYACACVYRVTHEGG